MVAWEKCLPCPLVCTHTHEHTYILVHTCTHACVHVCAHTLICRNTYMVACTHTCTCTQERTLTHLLLAVFRRTSTTKLFPKPSSGHTIKLLYRLGLQGLCFLFCSVLFADLGFCCFSFSVAASHVGWTDVHILFHFCPLHLSRPSALLVAATVSTNLQLTDLIA